MIVAYFEASATKMKGGPKANKFSHLRKGERCAGRLWAACEEVYPCLDLKYLLRQTGGKSLVFQRVV